jgi:hydroxymethylbilane synthase
VKPIYIATRGSALALAQSNMVLTECRAHFPDLQFDLKVIKTTGDRLQAINLTNPNQEVTKGLFTKELEVALLNGEADLAVHSLKDLPTELPQGLYLSAVSQREDARDVLIYRGNDLPPNTGLAELPLGATVATSSTRRQAQVLAARPDLKTVAIRGNVGTRLRKLAEHPELAAIILAMAGLKRLGFGINESGTISGADVPDLRATVLPLEQMLPCAGQAALGYESRFGDARINEICSALNHRPTFCCITAERAFLNAMGGGCLSPVAAYGEILHQKLRLRAVSFRDEHVRRGEASGNYEDARKLGEKLAAELR